MIGLLSPFNFDLLGLVKTKIIKKKINTRLDILTKLR